MTRNRASMMKLFAVVGALALVAAMLQAETPRTTVSVRNFDQELYAGHSRVTMAPPPGKVWTIRSASFVLLQTIQNSRVIVFEDYGDDGRFRSNIIHVDTGVYS